MNAEETFYKTLLDNLYDGVYFVDPQRKITYWNKAAELLTGYKASEVVGNYCADNILMHVNETGENLCKNLCPVAQTIADGKTREAAVYLHHRDGYRVPVFVRVSPIQDSQDRIIGAVEIFSDNTAHLANKQHIAELQKMALYDQLTEVGNRRYAEMNLEARLDELRRFGWRCGVMFFDIDKFKQINDTYGHDIGDKVLKMVARTLVNNVRSFDSVNRWGGEEFTAIIINVEKNQLVSIANKLRLLVEQSSFMSNSDTIRVTVSVGATLAQPDDTLETLIKRADQLMYQSKTSGGNRISTN